MSSTIDPAVEQSLTAALRAAESAPDSDDAWDHLESIAETLQRPDEVAGLFRELLRGPLPPATRAALGERAVRFHEEWYGDQPAAITDLLIQILERDPSAQWALDRLTVALTSREDWDALLDVYDRLLVIVKDDGVRKQLLADAAHVAKEFADKPGLAADYLIKLLGLEPDNQKLAATLERLLERLERWADLANLWESQLDQLPAGEARDLRVKVAALALDRLHSPGRALALLRQVLDDHPGHAPACVELERVLAAGDAALDQRRDALALLRKAYDASERFADTARVLEAALAFASDDDRRVLYRELANRLAIAGDDVRALGYYGELLRLIPGDAEARKLIRQLAGRAGRHDLHADALIAAAAATEGGQRLSLVLDAAQIRRDVLGDSKGAVKLFRQVLDDNDADANSALIAAHSLANLLTDDKQRGQRLAVLERLASLEKAPAIRQAILGEAAILAEALGKRERALAIWQHRLEIYTDDVEAMSAVIRLLESLDRWEELVVALLRRAAAPVIDLQRRSDLMKAADLLAFRLGDIDKAIDTLMQVREGFGEDPEVLKALDRQLTACARFGELASLLERSAAQSAIHTGWLYVRAAEIHLRDLEDPEAAARLYAAALSLDPARKEARVGLREILPNPRCTAVAVRALLDAYRRTDDWPGILDLLDPRLRIADTDHERAAILGEAARIYESLADDKIQAQLTLARALVHDPSDVAREHELLRLAAVTRTWAETAEALGQAADRCADTPARAAQLWFTRGSILARELHHVEAASLAFGKAAELEPTRVSYQEAAARNAARAGRWPEAAAAALRALRGNERHDRALLDELEAAARASAAWRDLADAAQRALDRHDEVLDATTARRVELAIAAWYDRAGAAAEATRAATRAVERDPTDIEALRSLAGRLRGGSPAARAEVLLKIDAIAASDLDALREAAVVAGEADDPELARSTLYRLYRKAARMWSRAEEATGRHQPEATAMWALEEVVKRTPPDVAARLLLDGATLPVTPARSRELRRAAAELLAGQGQRARAIDLYFGLLSDGDEALGDILRVAELCEQESRSAELLELRSRELAHTADPARRLALRLEISRLAGDLEARDSRVGALRENLTEKPGHPETIEALAALLTERGRHAELAEVLEDQARELAAAGHAAEAAALWARVAELAEEPLGELERAIVAHGKVVELAPTTHAVEALARLHLQREQPGEAAKWLRRRLEGAAPGERVAILVKLARAYIASKQVDEAIGALQTAFGEAPRNAEVRKLLLGLLRQRDNTLALANTLAMAAQHVADAATVLAYAREAATLYQEQIGAPELAVPVLERAIAFAHDDRSLKVMLAKGLLSSGRLPEAKELLTALIDGFGRRRSPERAQIHLLLAQVLHAEGDIAPAIDQLEAASSMDPGNIAILRTLAELARQSGQLARSERAYRTLLVNLRRADAGAQAEIGPAEVLLKLSKIAQERGQEDKAGELVESALEALGESDLEAPRIQDGLRERQEYALLRRVLEARLGHIQAPRQRAAILGELAELLEKDLHEPDAALDARLRALEADPGAPERHDAARDLAARLGKQDRYAKHIEGLLATSRRGSDAHARCELLLRLGAILERDRGDNDRAAELYRQAEALGVRQIDVWRAGARVAQARGDSDTQVRLLGLLGRLGATEDEARFDHFYRVAEIQLADPETLDRGLDSLLKVLAEEPRYGRAGFILQQAAERQPPSARFLEIYEDVARRSGDRELLLHCLEKRVARQDATPELTREAAELAIQIEAWERAEALLHRLVEVAQGAARDWALLTLARRRLAEHDLVGAVKWASEAAASADLAVLQPLVHAIADTIASEGGDITLVGKLYEHLLERDATSRAVWEPLCQIYRKLGDVDRLENMVGEILDGLQHAHDRNYLRRELAQALGARGRGPDAIKLLKAAVADDPDDLAARELLAHHLESSGDAEELLFLLRQQLDAAMRADDRPAIKALSLKIIARIRGKAPEDALDLANAALAVHAEDPELLRLVLDLGATEFSTGERGSLMERLLALVDGDEAAALTEALYALRKDGGQGEAAQRALELGHQRAPGHPAIFRLLEASLRAAGEHAQLAQLLQDRAKKVDAGERAELLRAAALLLRDHLGDAQGAGLLLMEAAEADPDNPDLRLELAAALSAAGDHQSALQTIEAGLQGSLDLGQNVAFLRCRAGVHAKVGDIDAALRDLDEAYSIDPELVLPEIVSTLRAAIAAADAREDEAAARAFTLRLVGILAQNKRVGEARDLLAAWVARAPADTDAMGRLWRMDLADENYESVVGVCSKLVIMTGGQEQVDAALALADAAIRLDRSQAARFGLEYVRSKQPDDAAIRDKLKLLYQQLGALRELSTLLIEEASQQGDPGDRLGTLRRVAEMLLDYGDRVALIPVLGEIVHLDPGDRESALTLAGIHLQAGHLDDADTILDGIISGMGSRRSPELGQMYYRKALIARARGDRDAELGFLQEAMANDKDNGHLAAEVAELAEALESWDIAMKVLRAITMMDSGECPITKAQAYARQARIAHRTGDPKRAIFWARRATQEDPFLEEAAVLLRQLEGE